MTIETGDTVSLEYVGRLTDGTTFDTSRQDVAEEEGLAEAQPDRDYEPLAVEVGAGTVIEGLDEGLVGMEVGDEESIEIPPEKAYGEPRDDLVQEHDPEQLREVLGGEPEEGMYVQTQQGGLGEIVHADDDVVRIDFNHELAGETLVFDIEILDAN
ncbi:peptidylprolyl isomerase (plasmid) [Haloferax mediterranei ATCC 33500]|uniref:Peptidyl-prolyl cis-trans isomerase n=1 Tax=Haloferax mediterranei (strain ATCC 33500 / DSM 1411 / JCM 8866 / NBRC 14739 / NCIMB 2177 / R-4) TaxID=523841 RepID=I3RBA5_HALMT|nr:peptidylprolyl isomerase [Haloferax mediterranei]AFK21515.1 peptidylprolyl isomerase [Haloferax mediterranei ATCC 33500]AHZ24430.1 peptidylprolyl isomerase [Haloferax mediterranei ATCC 33500]ELZ97171.1 peptidylprolyl isomerase FKBP-type [Haloferax mediterranei ATCC 33500]MDX5990085.1 peptidylprolyl isomerase [Haloferax mediterranei ATCC 33500]QCQ76830.1 peptidylprolyl isomerase [Haloferax mediterranei ATCC 33500]